MSFCPITTESKVNTSETRNTERQLVDLSNRQIVEVVEIVEAVEAVEAVKIVQVVKTFQIAIQIAAKSRSHSRISVFCLLSSLSRRSP